CISAKMDRAHAVVLGDLNEFPPTIITHWIGWPMPAAARSNPAPPTGQTDGQQQITRSIAQRSEHLVQPLSAHRARQNRAAWRARLIPRCDLTPIGRC